MTNGGSSDIVEDFRAGLDLLKRYPVIAAPPLVVMVLVFVMMVVFGGALLLLGVGGITGGLGWAGILAGGVFLIIVAVTVVFIAELVASGVVIVMARDALAGREPSLGDALGTVMGRLGEVAIASLLFGLVVMIGFLLLVLPGFAAIFFLMFTLPAVLLEDRGPVDALLRSVRLVVDNPGSAALLAVGVILVGVVVGFASMIVGLVPFLGGLASAVLWGAFSAYVTIVAVRVFQTLPRR